MSDSIFYNSIKFYTILHVFYNIILFLKVLVVTQCSHLNLFFVELVKITPVYIMEVKIL